MKKILLSISLILVSSLIATTSYAQNIAVVDTNKVFEESKLGKNAISYFEKLQNDGIKKLEAIEKKRNEADKKGDEKLLKNIESEMQAAAYELQTQMQAKQEKLFGLLSSKLIETIEKYRKENKLDAIFHAGDLASYNPEIDVTDKIIKDFNKITINFEKELSE